MNHSEWIRFLNEPVKSKEQKDDWDIDYFKFLDVKPGNPLDVWNQVMKLAGDETYYRSSVSQSVADMYKRYCKSEEEIQKEAEADPTQI